jgi:hypothetical protein
MVHQSKKDWWIGWSLAASVAVSLVVGAVLVGIAVVGSEWLLLVPGGALLLIGGFLAWVLRSTNYEITQTSLLIRSGPIRWAVPLDAIAEVIPQEGWYGRWGWGFSLSWCGLRLRYRKKSGRLTWPIHISPQDRSAFLLELAQRCPGLEAKDDGSLRRPASAGVAG